MPTSQFILAIALQGVMVTFGIYAVISTLKLAIENLRGIGDLREYDEEEFELFLEFNSYQ